MIECRGVVCCTDAGDPLFTGFDAVLGDAPETVILGAGGSGKTALALLLAGARLPDGGAVTVDGSPAARRAGAARPVGLVFQNPDDQFSAVTVERELAAGLENRAVPRGRMRALVDEYLQRYRLARLRHLSPHILSGGEKRRLALASVLITAPRYVVLDEPYAMMDDAAAAELRQEVRACAEKGTRVILLSKDPADRADADTVFLLADGVLTVLADGDPLPAALTYPGALPEPTGSGDVLLSAREITHGYVRGAALLDGVSLDVRAGERLLVTGAAGAGKTTLLMLLAGQVRSRSGRIAWRGASTATRAGARALRAGCAFGFQFPEEQFFAPSVDEELRYTARARGVPTDAAEERITRWAGLLGWDMARLGPRPPRSLGYGQRRIAAVLSLLVHGPDLVLLDEPFAGLDGDGVRGMQAVVRDAEDAGVTFVAAGHAGPSRFLRSHAVSALS